MEDALAMALDGEEYNHHSRNQDWLVSWHPGDQAAPEGKRHGSAAICVTPEGDVILVSADGGKNWELPAGRPEGDEDWRQTMEREMLEETCSVVNDARLLGFSKGICIKGHEEGIVLIRALWRADVTLLEWTPSQEISDRLIIPPDAALERVQSAGMPQIHQRWFYEAFGA